MATCGLGPGLHRYGTLAIAIAIAIAIAMAINIAIAIAIAIAMMLSIHFLLPQGATRGRVCFEVRVDNNQPVEHLGAETAPHVLRCGW